MGLRVCACVDGGVCVMTSQEDALQWVEENIPMTAMSNDNTMGSFPMDSDEEIMNTRYELSKME
eukprot:m.319161 g.319161  ORF g.319161 m.319161 type:complete len:64 (-) comp20298_c0_seq1:277-468(-)